MMFGAYFCSSLEGPIMNKRCEKNIIFFGVGPTFRALYVLLFILLLITSVILSIIIILIYHNPEFNAVNLLKSRYSQLKTFEPFLEIGLVFSSYLDNVTIVFLVAHTFGGFLFLEYFMHFPLVDKNISDIYGWMISIFEIFTTLFLIRETSNLITD